METYQQEFIEFLVDSQTLRFGDFTLKSGRKCPYFLNFGQISSGEHIVKLGKYYAHAVKKHIPDFQVVFGPAYKGIPLCVLTTSALQQEFSLNKHYCFNRKEAKDHGEGGQLVGAPLTSETKVVIIDDVMTAGTALRESLEILKKSGNPQVVGVMIAVDRMEMGQSKDQSAVQEIETEFNIPVKSIVTIADIVSYLYQRNINGTVYLDDEKKHQIEAYRKEYGI